MNDTILDFSLPDDTENLFDSSNIEIPISRINSEYSTIDECVKMSLICGKDYALKTKYLIAAALHIGKISILNEITGISNEEMQLLYNKILKDSEKLFKTDTFLLGE